MPTLDSARRELDLQPHLHKTCSSLMCCLLLREENGKAFTYTWMCRFRGQEAAKETQKKGGDLHCQVKERVQIEAVSDLSK